MATAAYTLSPERKSRLDRALSLVSDVRAGEGTSAVLLMVNIFLLLICYAVIKTVREPLILLGGGAEVRSYAAAGQAILYFQSPWGLQLEAITYPNGMAYEKDGGPVLWSPKDPAK